MYLIFFKGAELGAEPMSFLVSFIQISQLCREILFKKTQHLTPIYINLDFAT
jgi:hypothetical protein